MKSSDQGIILAIKLFDPGRERINWRYGSDYPPCIPNSATPFAMGVVTREQAN